MTWYELLNLTDIPDYARYMIIGIMLAAFHDLLANLINDDTLQISQFVPPCGNFVSAAAAGTSPGGCITPCQHGNAETVPQFYTLSSYESTIVGVLQKHLERMSFFSAASTVTRIQD